MDPLVILRPAPSNLDYHIMIKQKVNEPRQFALQLAIEDENMEIFLAIYQHFFQTFKIQDLCEIAQMLVGQRGECKWIKGFEAFLKSSLTKNVFRHFRPEEKELFVAETIIEPIFQAQKGNN